MSRHHERRRDPLAWLLAAAVGFTQACNGGGGGATTPTPTPTITVTLAPSSASVQQGASTSVSATVRGAGGFTGTPILTVTGIPTGVTSTVSNMQTSGSTTTATVTIAVIAGTTPGINTLTVTGVAPGVSNATATFALTVTAAPPGPAGTIVAQVANEGWVHIAEGVMVTYVSNPPASGTHYPVWARYEAYTTAVGRSYWVHNLEHGAIVMLYRPDTPAAVVTALNTAFQSLPVDPECGTPRALLTPDPLLPSRRIAVVAADWLLTADGVDVPSIRDFVLAHRNHAPENICQGGTRP